MRLKALLIAFTLLASLQCMSQTGERMLSSGSSASLIEEIAQLKGSGTITIDGVIHINFNTTVPSEISLEITNGGSFDIADGSTLQIEGSFNAGLHRIFNKELIFSGKGVSEVHSEWFGTDQTAVNMALLSAGKIPVRITEDIVIENTIYLDSYQTLLMGEKTTLSPSNKMAGKAVISNKNLTDSDITITGGIIDGTGADKVTYDGVQLNSVTNSFVQNLSCLNVHITASTDTGNIQLNNCSYVLLENCNVIGTWKMGVFILNGACNTIAGGVFYGTHDSGIGVVKSPGTTIDGLYVENCGTSDGSNMSLNSERLLVINNVSINANGERNGNGITLGHDGSPASYSICMNNLILNNRAKGIFIQGKETVHVLVLKNTVVGNGNQSEGTNSGGIAVYSRSKGHLISENRISGNRLGISLHKTSRNTTLLKNKIESSRLYGIRNDGESTIVKGNHLLNTRNIHNGLHHKNVSFMNNTTGPKPKSTKK